MNKLLAAVIPFLFLAGCGTSEGAINQAKSAIENGELEKAEKSLDTALDKKPQDKEALAFFNSLKGLNQVKAAIGTEDWDVALVKGRNLMKEKELPSSIKEALDEYIHTAEEKVAEDSVSDSEKQENDENLTASEPANTEKGESSATVSKRDEYFKKLKDVEKNLADLEALLETGTQTEMNKAQAEILSRWDQALNDIYGVLTKQLSASEMTRLRSEQRKWIKQRDAAATEGSLKYAGGTMLTLQYLTIQTQYTKERSYELVGSYLK